MHTFRDFIIKYNVTALVIGVAIGTAFAQLVRTTANGVVFPLILAATNGRTPEKYTFQISSGTAKFDVQVGEMLSELAYFFLLLFIVYIFLSIFSKVFRLE